MFFFIPVGMNYRTERLPLVTFSLIGLNTLVYVVSLIFSLTVGKEANWWIFDHLWLVPSQSHFWTYLTSMFVHAGIMHLVGNMIFLFLFGSCVEDMIGRGRFLAFYLIGGFIAGLSYVALIPEHFASEIPMGGASGAISTCMGMYLLLRADADIEFKYFFWLFYFRAGEFELPAWVAITFWFLKDLFWTVIGLLSQQSGGGVAFGAHVGGLLAGVILIGIWKLFSGKKKDEELIMDRPSATAAFQPATVRPAASTETAAIFILESGEQRGPYTLTQVQEQLRRCTIGSSAFYWSEGMADWQNVADLADGPIS